MAAFSLIDNFQNLTVEDNSNNSRTNATCLPFNPRQGFGVSPGRLKQVDRYLFRLFDKNSDGFMNNKCVKSKDATKATFYYDKDVFEREDRKVAAQALRRHLRWTGQPDVEDNFVSWSSSLLVVLQYAQFRAHHFRDSNFAEMFLCVVGTNLLPPMAFMRDLDLVKVFSEYDTLPEPASTWRLSDLQALRRKKYAPYSGSYDFGEYLSQGTLRIENCCSIVAMADIKDAGLDVLRRELAYPITGQEKWAKRVIVLRETFYDSSPPCYVGEYDVDCALRVGDLYGPTWKVPVALAFLALKPRRAWDEAIFEEFRPLYSEAEDHEVSALVPGATVVSSRKTLPEVQQFARLMQCLWEDYALHTILRKCKRANDELKNALELAELIPKLRFEARSLVESQPHYSALDAVAQTTLELEKVLSGVVAMAR